MNKRELATVLAGLRLLQTYLSTGQPEMSVGIAQIATNDGEMESLSVDEIDALCEALNTEPDLHDAIRSLLNDIADMHEEPDTLDDTLTFGPFSEYHEQQMAGLWTGVAIGWPNLAISAKKVRDLL